MKRKLFLLLLLMTAGIFCTNAQGRKIKLKVGDDAPPLHLQKWIKGTPVTKFEKGKVYLVDISAIFCPGCLTIIPRLTELSQKYRDKANVLVVYTYATAQQAQRFTEGMDAKMDYGVSVDTKENSTFKAWGISGFPSCFIVNQEGKIAYTGDDLDTALASIIQTGQYDAGAEAQRNEQWMQEWEEDNKIWLVYEKRKNEFEQKEDFKGLIHLIDSLLPIAPLEKKFHEAGRHGLLFDKFKTHLLDNDSIAADNCLKEMMALTTEGWWMHLQAIFTRLPLVESGQRLLPFNYQRYLEIAERAANDAGGASKISALCMQARMMYARKKNKAEALAVLNEAKKVAKKRGTDEDKEQVARTIAQIEEGDKKHQ